MFNLTMFRLTGFSLVINDECIIYTKMLQIVPRINQESNKGCRCW